MKNWAENEVKIACERENPDWNGKSFDYGCSCYKSALKAYNSLLSDGHSGFSFSITRNILIRLMNNLPLSPINEEDFKDGQTQCPRMSSLFLHKDSNGNISYSDIGRTYCININDENDTFTNGAATKIVNKLYPITMPYFPKVNKFKVYVEYFLTDKKNGAFDTQGFLYLITPEGEKVDLNIFQCEIMGELINISKEEYEKRKLTKIK